MLTLISATPSPYARKVRITLAEKNIPFTLQTEVPWDSTTKTPQYNPLEKLPVLILENGKEAVYESRFILEYIEAKYPDTKSMLPPAEDVDARLFARKVEVLADGICDALVLLFFEKQRANPSKEWQARQLRKVDGGLAALAKWVEGRDYVVCDSFGLADVAAGSVLGYLRVRWPDHPWMERHPELKAYSDKLEERQSFKETVPSPQKISDKIV
ncbi:hypothetical protein W97_05702 [Coniosporium apollinis CBS 100218]|uniref:Glutathione S-transferase domain-containing protein n=1 Tax=Coniosporium apollinis (strain CBS 100218) TaxID=1168221 RepID=R7YWX4_CONA1|nr:uncharacterized protein W97_05702 [Coniosporium apollinis CBS 100218]EON66309.1 hypothetical protein W97_05702 [Coniosporium apollinis CBS 100218]